MYSYVTAHTEPEQNGNDAPEQNGNDAVLLKILFLKVVGGVWQVAHA